MITAENLVVLKEGVKTFTIDDTAFTYKPHVYYRALPSNFGMVVGGVDFKLEYFNEVFETVQARMLRDFEKLGIIVNGKIITRTSFKKKVDATLYGNRSRGFYVCYIYTHPKELMYAFMPHFSGDTKTNSIINAYNSVLEIIDGRMDCVDEDYVQFCNTGKPISMNPSTKLSKVYKDLRPFEL